MLKDNIEYIYALNMSKLSALMKTDCDKMAVKSLH